MSYSLKQKVRDLLDDRGVVIVNDARNAAPYGARRIGSLAGLFDSELTRQKSRKPDRAPIESNNASLGYSD